MAPQALQVRLDLQFRFQLLNSELKYFLALKQVQPRISMLRKDVTIKINMNLYY